MKENHEIESLEVLSKSVSRECIRRLNSPSRRIERSWHPGPIKAVLTAGSLAFLCVISLLLMQDIHPAPTKLTIQRDAAELVRLEAQLRVGDSYTATRSLPSSAVPSWVAFGSERISYMGLQIALALDLGVLTDYGPSTQIDAIRDRFIGIVLGILIISTVFSLVWPEDTSSIARQKLAASCWRSLALSIFAAGMSQTQNGRASNWKSRHIWLKLTPIRNMPRSRP
jgi:hypothetical protein